METEQRIEKKKNTLQLWIVTVFSAMAMVIGNMAAFLVPEEVKNRIQFSRRVVFGIIIAIVLTGCFVGLYIWYGECDSYKVLTRDLDGMDLEKCVIDPNSFFTTLRLDTQSKWELDSAFSQASAFWQVKFLGYSSKSIQTFQENLDSLCAQVDAFLQKAVNLQTFDLLQYFLHARFVAKGDQGFAQLMPSFSLTSYISNFELSKIQFFRSNQLQNCAQSGNLNCQFETDIESIKSCGDEFSGPFLQYDINRLGSLNKYYKISRSGTEFEAKLNLLKQFQGNDIVQLFDANNCSQSSEILENSQLISKLENPITAREVPYFEECTTCKIMDVSFDFALINALDFCNKNSKVCSSFYNFENAELEFPSEQVYVRIKQIVQSRYRTSSASFYDEKIGKFCYTRYELGNEYSIVPEILPTCPLCNSDLQNLKEDEDCSKEFDIVFHYYLKRSLNNIDSRKRRSLLQSLNTQSSNISANASFEISGTSSAELQSQLVDATSSAIAAIEANPDDLNSALTNLLQAIANSLGNILITIVQGGTLDAETQSDQISIVIGNALQAIVSSATGPLATLDVAKVQSDIKTNVSASINQAGANAEVTSVIEQIGQGVLSIVGQEIASVLGLSNFSSSIPFEFQQQSQTSTTGIQPVTENQAGQGGVILNLLLAGNITSAKSTLESMLLQGDQSQLVDIFNTAYGDENLRNSLINLLVSVYQDADFNALPLSVAYGEVYSANSSGLIDFMSEVLLEIAKQEQPAVGLSQALSFAFTSQSGGVRETFQKGLEVAIATVGCQEIGPILLDTVQEAGPMETLLMIQWQQIPEFMSCLQVGHQLQSSLNILSYLNNPSSAAGSNSTSLSADSSQLRMMLDASPFDVNATVAAFHVALQDDSIEDLPQILLDAASTNPQNLVAFLAAAFGTYVYPGVALAEALNSASKLAGGTLLTDILSKAMIKANEAGPAATFADTLSFLVTTGGDTLSLYLDALSTSIKTNGCNAVAQALADTNDHAIFRDVNQQFVSAMNNNSDINDCLQVGIRQKLTTGILKNIKLNPFEAVDLIIKAATDKYPAAISDAIVQAVNRNNTDDINAIRTVMDNVLRVPGVPVDQLTLAFTMASEVGSPEVQKSITHILSQPYVEPQVARIIAYAFGPEGTLNTTQSFVNIIKHSVSGNTCGLQSAVQSALSLAQNSKDIINIVMNNPDIQSCIQTGIAALLSSPVLNHLGFIGSKSYYYSVEKLSWAESFERCQSLGGSLLQLNSKATEATINILLQTNLLFQYTKSYQTGLIEIPSTKKQSNGTFFWIGLQNIDDNNGTVKQQWSKSKKSEYQNWCSEKNILSPPKTTSQLYCIAALFEFEKGLPSGCWEFALCKDQNSFICEFDVEMKQQIGALPQSFTPPSLPIFTPPSFPNLPLHLPLPQLKSTHQQNLTSPQTQPPPPIVQVLTNMILNNNDLNQVLEFQYNEQPQIIIDIHDLQTLPLGRKVVSINESGYEFKSGGDFNPDSEYQFSVLISLKSSEPQLAYNQFETFMPQIQCNGSSIKFVESNQTVEVPFVLSSNIYECEVENCSTVLEKLALAFANIEFFYCFIVLFMIFMVLVCCQNRNSTNSINYDDPGSIVENFFGFFTDCMEATSS